MTSRNHHIMRTGVCLAGGAVLALMAGAVAAQGLGEKVEQTRHNLTASGPGPIKSTAGGESCRFCHTPHAANPIAPLWNRADPGNYYQTYDSSTLVATVGQPSGSSRLCLSCHDGTIALGQTFNAQNTGGAGTIFISQADRGFIGTDLSDDHPISFVYGPGVAATKGELAHPASIPKSLPLDQNGQLQCTTCHDPHNDAVGNFLRVDNQQSGLCRSCHQLDDWAASAHATSTASLAGASADKWDNITAASVRDAACESCHRPHNAGGRERLLRHEAEEDNCLNCHDGSVASTNILAQVQQFSAHDPRTKTGVHDPTENPTTMSAHVECGDCHNPHRAGSGGADLAPLIKSAMKGASGMSSNGQPIATARYEYEVCYKCHSTRNVADAPQVDRVLGSDNIAHEFASTNASYHPVETSGRNMNVPSLLQSYDPTSIIYCTDCHSTDNDADGKGPHGSAHTPMLSFNYTVRDNTVESPQAYALCYQCHSRTSILGDESFKEHRRHIVDQNTPCAVCHDPHGVDTNTHLINFDRDVVEAASNGDGPTFIDLGEERGSCTLNCHGKDHVDLDY